jgi:hypothetical protein
MQLLSLAVAMAHRKQGESGTIFFVVRLSIRKERELSFPPFDLLPDGEL